MFLDKLQSGFLLFETEQGLVRVELTPRQRLYLLWTFRHFRQLSVPLLNLRERALVNTLFRNNTGVGSDSLERLPVIGVVENFVPSEVQMDASPAPQLAPKPVLREEQQEQVVAQRVEIVPKPKPAPSSSPVFAWSKQATSQLATFKLAPFKLAAPKFAMSKLATSRLATAASAVSLCVISVVALNRIQAIPSSQAHNQPRLEQISAIIPTNSATPTKPAAIAESPAAIAPLTATAQPVAAAEAPVTTASITPVVPTIVPGHVRTHNLTNIPTPKRVMPVHHVASTPSVPGSSPDDSIQASRPPLRFAYPVYTDVRARGAIALRASVDPDGAVRSVRMVSGKRALAAAAVRAVRQWRYRPYLKDGQPVATETNIVISLFSDDAISMSFPPSIPAIR
jgi:TonB family protein